MRSIDGEVESSSGSRSGCPSYNLSVTFGDSSPSRGASGGAEKFPMEDEALRNASASPFGRGVTEGDGEGKPGTKEHLHSDKHWLLIESSYRCVFVLSQHPCPLRRSAPALPEGEPWAKESVISITKKAPGTMRNVPGAFRTKRRDAETLRLGGWLFSGSVRCGLRRPR